MLRHASTSGRGLKGLLRQNFIGRVIWGRGETPNRNPQTMTLEQRIRYKLEHYLHPDDLIVNDISGGCGAMFEIRIVSKQFEGKSLVSQHRLVNECISDEISQMHGLTLKTAAK